MYVRVRCFGHPEATLIVASRLTKIEQFRLSIRDKFEVNPECQRLMYGGKLLEDGYTFHDYNIKLNDVIQLMEIKPPTCLKENNVQTEDQEKKQNNVEYKDAVSTVYAVGDLIDVLDEDKRCWVEGSITKIVRDAKIPEKNICSYHILYKVTLNKHSLELLCNQSEIRPRARKVIPVKDIQIGQIVMVNYNIESPGQKGDWYDLKVKIKNAEKYSKLIGTLLVGSSHMSDCTIPIQDKIFSIEEPVPLSERNEEYKKSMAIVPPKRNYPIICETCKDDEDKPCRHCSCYICAQKHSPDKMLLCDECDNAYHMECLTPPLSAIPEDDWYCEDCKRDPNEVVAPGGSKQAKKTTDSRSKRDWGRGMACVGKTKDSEMPKDHFGPIPGIEVGMIWRYRMQLSEAGLHRPSVSGIHGRNSVGAFSIVLSGGYEDDVDNGIEFMYTGSGGRDLSKNRRTAEQSRDQSFTRENRALALNCSALPVSAKGGDAGDNWRKGKPVRVMRSYKMRKAFPKYAPKEGIRYDGIYKVVKYYPEVGLSGFSVFKYLLRRDDPSPAPWEPGAKLFTIVYPDGYLEAQEQKKQNLKENKNNSKTIKNGSDKNSIKNILKPVRKANKSFGSASLESSLSSDSTSDASDAAVRMKTSPATPLSDNKTLHSSGKGNSANNKRPRKRNWTTAADDDTDTKDIANNVKKVKIEAILNEEDSETSTNQLTRHELKAIESDKLNDHLWKDCLERCRQQTKKDLIDVVREMFRCIICQGLVISPVTTPCIHSFCLSCIERACKISSKATCPHCRQELDEFEPVVNEPLRTALRALLPGYDAGH